jgi:hypothetical protein
MKENKAKRAYTAPVVTDFGAVSVVTAATGATFKTDTCFTGSMEFGGQHECIPGQS